MKTFLLKTAVIVAAVWFSLILAGFVAWPMLREFYGRRELASTIAYYEIKHQLSETNR